MIECLIVTWAVLVIFCIPAFLFEKISEVRKKSPVATRDLKINRNLEESSIEYLYYSEMFKRCQPFSDEGGEK